MSKKKPPKAARKAPPVPASDVVPEGTAPLVPSEQNVESDAPAVAGRSLEADDQDGAGDIERAGE